MAHTIDAHCAPYIDDSDACTVCGVDHSGQCDACGGRGFHAPGCRDAEEAIDLAAIVGVVAATLADAPVAGDYDGAVEVALECIADRLSDEQAARLAPVLRDLLEVAHLAGVKL
jgi:hypothetical protein